MKYLLHGSLVILFSLSFAEEEGVADSTRVLQDSALLAADNFRRSNRITAKDEIPSIPVDQLLELKRRVHELEDPETKFGYVVFSVDRHSEILLDDGQALELKQLIEKRRTALVNWHDVRNVIRIYARVAIWELAIAEEGSLSEKAESRWEKWNEMRIRYMREEFLADERFHCGFREILSKEQWSSLKEGKWDEYLKKRTGHSRNFFAPKIVRRTLGEPTSGKSFDGAIPVWEAKWRTMKVRYEAASLFERKRGFLSGTISEAEALCLWEEYVKAFREWSTLEAQSIRGLVQAGYSRDENTLEKVKEHQMKLILEVLSKYGDSADDLINRMVQSLEN
ncbi:MAG: hypothetical protein P1U58_17615 [Verrucomicrobiales bacterium]|nr:hypothetical protein [Verrucomicrobiales bacterium]